MTRKPLTWPENVEPTAEQFTHWFLSNDRDEQVGIAEQLLRDARTGATCFIQNHDALLGEVQHLRDRLANVRQEIGNELLNAWDAATTPEGGDQ
jgi:hypothetical protein